MKGIIENLFGFLYTLSMGDYIFLSCTFLILVAFIYVIYLMKKDEEKVANKSNEMNMLESIKETIEKEYKPEVVVLTDYEKEQEENAIISYEELINNKNKLNISYDDEYESSTNEVLVKKINITDSGENDNNTSELSVRLMSYDKEEAFLTALKQLQQNLIN